MSIAVASSSEGEAQNHITYSDSPLAYGIPPLLITCNLELPKDIPGLENASGLLNYFAFKNDFSKGYLSFPFAEDKKIMVRC